MWVLLLPLPWLLLGLCAAGLRRRGKPGCLFVGGVFVWPQARLLEALDISVGTAWLISLAIMAVCPIIGYLLGLHLLGSGDSDGPSQP
jgi:hypothetical protein